MMAFKGNEWNEICTAFNYSKISGAVVMNWKLMSRRHVLHSSIFYHSLKYNQSAMYKIVKKASSPKSSSISNIITEILQNCKIYNSNIIKLKQKSENWEWNSAQALTMIS